MMADHQPQQNIVNKPGTSCLGCRRRKLKCDRAEEGCHNCKKSDLPCIYPAPDTGLKRKRGPYKKDKPARERHMEDMIKYLGPKDQSTALSPTTADTSSPGGQSSSSGYALAQAGSSGSAVPRHPGQTSNADTLVQDALVALSRSGLANERYRHDDPSISKYVASHAAFRPATNSRHPEPRLILEYWHLFTTRVDPMTKVIHCPTFSKTLSKTIDNMDHLSPSVEAIMFSIYYSALSTCTARDARHRFGEAQDVLMLRYSQYIENIITDESVKPDLEAVQALVLYLICIRGKDHVTDLTALFSLALRLAQQIGLEYDPEGRFPPYETELRRRLWFHLCGLEARTAEESRSRNAVYLKHSNVQLPKNLNDCDLGPLMHLAPESRDGVTDMTFPILRFEIHKLIFGLHDIRRGYDSKVKQEGSGVSDQLNEFFDNSMANLHKLYMQHMHPTRPYDWMCLTFIQGLEPKARTIIEFPDGPVPTKEMPKEERMRILRYSVQILHNTHGLAVDERISDWNWYFQGYVQWHALAIVVAELGWSQDNEFSNNAWRVLDPLLTDWDKVYKRKKNDKAWEHVNTLIDRARHARHQRRLQLRPDGDNTFKKPRTESNSLPPIQHNVQQQPTNLPSINAHAPSMQDSLPFHHYNTMSGNINPVPSPSASAGAHASPQAPSLSSGMPTPGSYSSLAQQQYSDGQTPLEYFNPVWDPAVNMDFGSVDFGAWHMVWQDDTWLSQEHFNDMGFASMQNNAGYGGTWYPATSHS